MKTGFYFATDDNKLRYGDDREIVVGETHIVDCKPKCCEAGLHASERLIDALGYAPGSQLYLVEVSGDIDESSDKFCGTHRKYVAHFDADSLLREFARKQALINIEKIKPYCTEEEYKYVLEFLNGNLELRSAARSAAWSAESAAWSAASAAQSAAQSAARSAWSAARSAESAAWSAQSAAQSARSAESAARSAARSAESAAYEMLTQMVKDATGWDI